jgi:hypothetical protein
VREGDMIPYNIRAEVGKEEAKREKTTMEEGENNAKEMEETMEKVGEKRKRGRWGRKIMKKQKMIGEEEERMVRNREGQTLQQQRERDGEKEKEQWMEKELNDEWEIEKIVQELEFDEGKKYYRIQFKRFKKLSNAE